MKATVANPLLKTEKLYDGAVIRIFLNRPPQNLVGQDTLVALSRELKKCGMQRGVKLVVLEGCGKNFSFGGRIQDLSKNNVSAYLRQVTALFYTMIEFNVPTAAVVRGQCLGTGMELAVFCDWVFAAENAQLGFPEIKLGICPVVGSILLPWLVGQSNATEMILGGQSVSAKEAEAIGLVHAVTSARRLETTLRSFIEKEILDKSATALRMARRMARRVFHGQLRKELAVVEKEYLERLMTTHDANEGIAAFLGKRPPQWKNC